MERCETCRWWDQSKRVPIDCPDIPENWGVCDLTAGPHSGGGKAHGFDWDKYDVSPVYTAPDFGCVQWTAKEEDI